MTDESWLDLQDTVVWMVCQGFPFDEVIGMDMISFNSLSDSLRRLDTAKKIESAWTSMVAAQGGHKDMKNLTKGWGRAAGLGPEDDEAELIALFGALRH